MLLNPIASLARDIGNQRIQIIAFKVGDLAAALAEKQMLMPTASRDIGLACPLLMNTLDQAQFLEFLQGPIHRDEPQGGVPGTGCLEDIERCEGTVGGRHRLHDGPACPGHAATIESQGGDPVLGNSNACHRCR